MTSLNGLSDDVILDVCSSNDLKGQSLSSSPGDIKGHDLNPVISGACVDISQELFADNYSGDGGGVIHVDPSSNPRQELCPCSNSNTTLICTSSKTSTTCNTSSNDFNLNRNHNSCPHPNLNCTCIIETSNPSFSDTIHHLNPDLVQPTANPDSITPGTRGHQHDEPKNDVYDKKSCAPFPPIIDLSDAPSRSNIFRSDVPSQPIIDLSARPTDPSTLTRGLSPPCQHCCRQHIIEPVCRDIESGHRHIDLSVRDSDSYRRDSDYRGPPLQHVDSSARQHNGFSGHGNSCKHRQFDPSSVGRELGYCETRRPAPWPGTRGPRDMMSHVTGGTPVHVHAAATRDDDGALPSSTYLKNAATASLATPPCGQHPSGDQCDPYDESLRSKFNPPGEPLSDPQAYPPA